MRPSYRPHSRFGRRSRLNRQRQLCSAARRSGSRRLSAEALERRDLLAVTFQFDFVEDNVIGFNDPTNGADFRSALQSVADRFGNAIINDAIIDISVQSFAYTGDDIAGAASELPPAIPGGGFADPLIATKIKGETDFNGVDADGRLEVHFPEPSDSLQFELDPTDVDSGELDFGAVVFHELVHAVGWTSATTASGADDDGAGLGSGGTWRPYDAFLSDSAGNRLIDGDANSATAFQMDTTAWSTTSTGGVGTLTPGDVGNGLYFAGPIASFVYGGPVPLFSPDPFLPASSVVHLDSEGFPDTASPFDPTTHLMSHGIVTGAVPQQLTTLEVAILADIGIQTVEDVPPVLTLPSLNLFLEGDTTGGYSTTGMELTDYLATVLATDNVDPNPTLGFSLPALLPLGINTVTVTATDWSGNESTGDLTIVVDDDTPPELTVSPTLVTLEATSSDGVTGVTLPVTAIASDIVDPNPIVDDGGNSFALGDSIATFAATDSLSNSSTQDVTVRVVDTTPPAWNQTGSISVVGNSFAGSTLDNPLLVAGVNSLFTDAVDDELTLLWDVTELSYGANTVSVTVTDDFNNQIQQSLQITVEDNRIAVTTADDESDVDPLLQATDVSLREAIQVANDRPGHDVIYFDASVVDSIVLDPTLGTLPILDSLSLFGIDRDTTLIDGNNLIGVFRATEDAGDLLIDGLTIQNGLTTAEFAFGAGIRFDSTGVLTVRDSLVTGNQTTGSGGAGAGIQSTEGDVRIERTTVSDNETSGAFSAGGGIWTGGGNLTITDSQVTGNSTTSSYATGGGVYALSGVTTISRSTIDGNSTAGGRAGGGGISALVGTITVLDSTISNNSTTGNLSSGGGIRALRSDVTIRNSTITGNTSSSSDGGGVELDQSTATITSSTISANTANLVGGGIHAFETDALLNLAGSIVAGNTDNQTAPDISADASQLGSIRFSLIGNNAGTPLAESGLPTPDNGNLIGDAAGSGVVDPLLFPLADNGGPTLTIMPSEGSPAIDAGDPDFDENGFDPTLTFDQRGPIFSRLINGRIDLGAIERVSDVMLQWDSPEDIVFRTPLSSVQLDAQANVPGTFSYVPPAGILLSAGQNQTLRVTFTPTDPALDSVSLTTTINVFRANPVITWQPGDVFAAGTVLDESQLSATADAAGTFVYDPPAGTTLTAGLNQTLTATFTPDDAVNFESVTTTVSIDVIGRRDFGDAPDPYPVRLADDGPRHGIDSEENTIFLGTGLTVESDGVASPLADSDSDDSFELVSNLVTDPTNPTTTTALIVASADARLDAWIDFNGDGDWNDVGEQLATAMTVTAGVNRLPIVVPAGSQVGSTVARVRISSIGGLAPTGPADDGEVEDHLVSIGAIETTVVQVQWTASPLAIVEENGQWVIRIDATNAIELPQRTDLSLAIVGDDVSQSITVPLGFVEQIESFSVDGTTRRNELFVTGDGVLDLSGDATGFQNLRVLDLSDPAAQQLVFDSAGIGQLSPDVGIVEIVLGSEDAFRLVDGDGWRIVTDDPNDPLTKVATNASGDLQIQATVGSAWTNFIQSGDVDNNGAVTPIDALRVINEIRRRTLTVDNTSDLMAPAAASLSEMVYPDVNGSGTLTPVDALSVINIIRRSRSTGGGGESLTVGNGSPANLDASASLATPVVAVPIAQMDSTESVEKKRQEILDQVMGDWAASSTETDPDRS